MQIVAQIRKYTPQNASKNARATPHTTGADELRGSLWAVSPSGVQGAAGPRKRRGSGLADEGLAKKRKEGRT